MCFPKYRCDKQTIDVDRRSARLFIFCDQARDERLSGAISLQAQYFNAAISDGFCIGGPSGHRVGEKCEKKTGDPNRLLRDKAETSGVCTLMQTEAMMDVDIRFDYPLQR